ncbi:MAG: hypothetical protein HYS34_09675 [Acidobacteria bacterium]|nr:hypothetical protein [Acidobacteriota bacterium]
MGSARGQLHTIVPMEPEGPEESRRSRRRILLKCNFRPADADFFCWKYGVWYNLLDCCYRHARKTYGGCASCGQGASNLKVNKGRFLALRHTGMRRRTGR